jgi:hypothetical protein
LGDGRRRFLSIPEARPTLTGIVEADETFVLLSYNTVPPND